MAFYDLVLSASKSHTLLWVACERGARDAAAAGDHGRRGRVRPGREGPGGGVDGRAPGDARLPGRARPATPAPGITAAAAAGGWTRTTGRPRSSCSTTPASTTRSCTCTARRRTRRVCAGREGPRPGLLADPAVARRRRRLRRPVRRGATCGSRLGVRWERAARTGRRGRSPGSTPTRRTCSPSGPPRSRPALEKLVARFRAETGREPTNRERAALAERASTPDAGGEGVRRPRPATGSSPGGRRSTTPRSAPTSPRSPAQALGRAPAAARAVLRAGRRHPGVGGDGGHPPVLDPLEPDDGRLQRAARAPRASAPSRSSRCWRG